MGENYYSTNVNDTAEYFAAKYIEESARERDAQGLGDFMESEGLEWKSCREADWDELRDAIYTKIGSAVLDIDWPERREL